MKSSGYNTNLAAEYYVLSMLYRKRLNAYLTLGKKKSIDIIVDHGKRTSTIDVKGMISKTIWPMDNFSRARRNHFMALVTFLNKIGDHTVIPETYIIPSSQGGAPSSIIIQKEQDRIRHSAVKQLGNKYREAWHLIK